MDVVFCEWIKTNMDNTFKYFSVNQNIGKNPKKLVEFFKKLIVFKAENPNIEKLRKIKM